MTEEKDVAVENGHDKNESADYGDETELERAIIRQVEYYFGDFNLPRDKFLREQVQLDEGWVPLDVLITFNRLSKLTTDVEVIVKALAKSTSGLLEISEDNKKIRRHPEVPIPELNEDRRKELAGRTIYAKGFPKDGCLDDILKFFKKYDDVENIIMRKYQERNTKKRLFKGSVFALFKTKEQAEKFINTKDIKYEDKELLILWQDDYNKQKQEEYASRKEQKEKKTKQKEQEQTQANKEEFKLPTGTVLYFTQGTDKMKREDIKDALTEIGAGEISYIDFKVGDTEGWVRMAKENGAKELNEKITDGKVKIAEADVVFRLLEDDEEKAYLVKTIEEMSKRRRNMKNNRYNNKGNNRGRNFKGKQGKKRKQDHSDDGPPTKVKADA